ncbi:hypothetical protein Bca52824_060091 [Brassica carinata]|uniref:Uncharacterized protein n=1 Tax=Brassica carinata TaxID=52824 RepID=A0A8X7UIV2_BRACI|nr:hypothetical protein Bca52824_060091 [Brassica carinata]
MAGPTVAQFILKKTAEKPSGPGALSGWIRKRASLISFAVGITVNASLSSAEMNFLRASSTMLDGSELFVENRLEKYFVITSIISGSS